MSRDSRRTGPRRRLRSLLLLATPIAVCLAYLALRGPGSTFARLSLAARSLTASAFAPDKTATAGDINVVVFVIDTLRADRLNTYGYTPRTTSPNLDALAEHGVVFEQAYAAAPWTLPSMASVMTSRFVSEHGLVSTRQRFTSNVTTLPQVMKAAGYTTIGLYGNAMVSPAFGFGRGYDSYTESLVNEGEQVSQARRLHPGRPFFLYVHNIEPQQPERFAPVRTPGYRDISAETRAEITSQYRQYRRSVWKDYDDGRPLCSGVVASEQEGYVQALAALRVDYSELYDAAVREADRRLGSVIQALKDRGEWENTLFVLLSDHGDEMYEHCGWSHDQSVYEELVHVPLVIRFPHDRYAGNRVEDIVSLVDVMPTVLDCIGHGGAVSGLSGKYLPPLIRGLPVLGAIRVPSMRQNVMSSNSRWRALRGDTNIVIRQREWKGIWNVDVNTFELYDLAADPGERSNVAAAHRRKMADLLYYARRWYAQHGAQSTGAPTVEQNQLDDKTIRSLRTLGYVE